MEILTKKQKEESTLVCLQVCEFLKREKPNRQGTEREKSAHQYDTCIATKHALHDGKP